MQVKYCNADCQKNHWATHKKDCKLRAAELHDEALFKDPPSKEECPICFLPMPVQMICCISTQPATKSSVLIADIAGQNLELADLVTEEFYSCCGKGICKGCIHSFSESGNDDKCSFCNSDRCNKTVEEIVEEYSRRVEADDVGAMYALGCIYYNS